MIRPETIKKYQAIEKYRQTMPLKDALKKAGMWASQYQALKRKFEKSPEKNTLKKVRGKYKKSPRLEMVGPQAAPSMPSFQLSGEPEEVARFLKAFQ